MCTGSQTPPLHALDIATRQKQSAYPEPYGTRMAGRLKRQLGNHFGLKNFGVNLTTLAPGGESALLHRHSEQDEFIYVLEGTPTLRSETGEEILQPGMCAGLAAGGAAHQLVNRSDATVLYLEIGDRTPGDEVRYPEDDLMAVMKDGAWVFSRKDGTPYG